MAASSSGAIDLVALGDSATTGHGDPAQKGWVVYLADEIRAKAGRSVTVDNRARDGTTSAELLHEVESDEAMRTAIAGADIVVIGIGGNDLNLGDEAVQSGSCAGKACYDKVIADYGANLTAVAGDIAILHRAGPVILRAIGMPNALPGAESAIPGLTAATAKDLGVYQARLIDDATCAAMTAHGGVCIPLLEAFNGPHGTDDAYSKGLMNLDECCYPTAMGHRLIADLVYKTGVIP